MNVDSFIKGFASGIEKNALSVGKLKSVVKSLARRASAIKTGAKPRPQGKRGITEPRQIDAVVSRIGNRLLSGKHPGKK